VRMVPTRCKISTTVIHTFRHINHRIRNFF